MVGQSAVGTLGWHDRQQPTNHREPGCLSTSDSGSSGIVVVVVVGMMFVDVSLIVGVVVVVVVDGTVGTVVNLGSITFGGGGGALFFF